MDCPLFLYSAITARIKSTAPALPKQNKDGKVKCLSNYALTVELIKIDKRVSFLTFYNI